MATKIPFRTNYTEKKRFNTNAGSKMQNEYAYEVNAKGQKVLVKTGEKNLYLEIQSYKEDCLIETILQRAAVGDMRDFRPQGIYADISKVPNNLIQAKREMVKLENTWNKLPNEIKQKYDNSVETFIASAGSESWLVDMGLKEVAPTIINTAPETKPNIPETKKE